MIENTGAGGHRNVRQVTKTVASSSLRASPSTSEALSGTCSVKTLTFIDYHGLYNTGCLSHTAPPKNDELLVRPKYVGMFATCDLTQDSSSGYMVPSTIFVLDASGSYSRNITRPNVKLFHRTRHLLK